jgi:hypothetical protein
MADVAGNDNREKARCPRRWFWILRFGVILAALRLVVALVLRECLPIIELIPGSHRASQNRGEIAQLEMAVAIFHRDFSIDNQYFPSRLRLCERLLDYDLRRDARGDWNTPLDGESFTFLSKMFPRIDWHNRTGGIDWNGNGKVDSPGVTLEGDQCLVFFLGGIPSGGRQPDCLGFSKDPSDPAARGGERKGPYFAFDPGRLTDLKGNGFFSCLDVFGKRPFAYFSSYRRRNGYNRYFGTRGPSRKVIRDSDCASLGVWPYAESVNGAEVRYLNPSGFQIISGGTDGKFGPGTDLTVAKPFTWTPARTEETPAAGQDDQANFSNNLLGEGS